MIEDTGTVSADDLMQAPPFVATCFELARVAVTECFWRVYDRIAWKREDARLAKLGYVTCPVCKAGDERATCRTCQGYGCVTFEKAREHEELVQAIMRGDVTSVVRKEEGSCEG